MKEKVFLFLIIILILVGVIISDLPRSLTDKGWGDLVLKSPKLKKYPPYIKGVYLTSWTASNPEKIDYFIDLAKKTEINAVIIDIKEVDGLITFDTQSDLINSLDTEFVIISDLKNTIKKFHKQDIYVIARMVVFKDNELPKSRPDLALKNKEGKVWRDWANRTWLDPTSKEVWDYHIELAKEAAKIGFDEINFDYIRFPSDGDLGQIAYSHVENSDLPYNEIPKASVMKEFFEYISEQLKSSGVFISANLFGLVLWREGEDDMNIGQILEYALPYFDIICPMVYPSHYANDFEGYKNPAEYPYEIIKMNLEKGQLRSAGARAKLRPWLQDFDMNAIYDKEMINLQKQAVYDTNSFGWLLWNPASRYTESAMK